MNEIYDCIVIGAGVSGIVAANNILKTDQNQQILILEARNRIGGRVYTKQIGEHKLEIGAGWIGETQTKMYQYCKQYNIQLYPQYQKGKSQFGYIDKYKRVTNTQLILLILLFFVIIPLIFHVDININLISIFVLSYLAIKKLSRPSNQFKLIQYYGTIPILDLQILIKIFFAIRKINKLSSKINLQKPWLTQNAEYMDSITFEQWFDQQFKDPLVKKLFLSGSDTIFCLSLNQISLLQGLFYVKSGTNFDILINFKGGAQQDQFVKGAQHLLEQIINDNLINKIRYNQPVVEINDDPTNQQFTEIITASNQIFKAKTVIITIPPTLILKNVQFTTPLPYQKIELLQKYQMGTIFKIWLVYETPFWRQKGLSGLTIGCDEIFSSIMDSSPPNSTYGMLIAFSLQDQFKQGYFDLSKKERQLEIVNCLQKYYGQEIQKPILFSDEGMNNDPYSGGCPVGLFGPKVLTKYGQYIRNPIARLHFAGTQTSFIWNGYMEGALRSGQRASQQVIQVLKQNQN